MQDDKKYGMVGGIINMENTKTEIGWKESVSTLDKCKNEFYELRGKLFKVRQNVKDKSSRIEEREQQLNIIRNSKDTPQSQYESRIKEIESDYEQKTNQSRSKFDNIKKDANKKLDDSVKRINNQSDSNKAAFQMQSSAKVDGSLQHLCKMYEELNDLREKIIEKNEEINTAQEEQTQILRYQSTIEPDYINISNNARLNNDLGSNRYSHQEIDEKYNSISDEELVNVAKRLSDNQYFSYPTKSGIPIGEILVNIFSVIATIFAFIGKGLSWIYKVGVKKISSLAGRVIYCIVISVVLFVGMFFLIKNAGGVLLIILLSLLGLFVLFLLTVLIINLAKYSNRKMRAEQNFSYYSVGFYYYYEHNKIMGRIATYLFNKLKIEDPGRYNEFVNESLTGLQQEINRISSEHEEKNKEYLEAKERHDKLQQEESVNVENANKRFDEMARQEIENERAAHKGKLDNANLTLSNELQNLEKQKQKSLQEAKDEANNSEQNLKNKIIQINSEIQSLRAELDSLKANQTDLEINIKTLSQESEEQYLNIVEGKTDIEVINVKKGFDSPVQSFFAGIKKSSDGVEIGSRKYGIYESVYLDSYQKPVIIKYSGFGDEDSKSLSNAIYGFANCFLSQLVANMYFKSFTLQIIDTKIISPVDVLSRMAVFAEEGSSQFFLDKKILELYLKGNHANAEQVITNILNSRAEELNTATFA